jgi:hypothetical protein
MANIIDYVEEIGKFDLLEAPFNSVDSLILSQLSYVRLDGLIPGVSAQEPVCITELLDIPNFEDMFWDVRDSESNRKLFIATATSRRFCNTRLNYYVNNINNDIGKQFSAVTFFLDEGIAYMAIRGTDSTIVGWKEDFNMAFMCPVPAQEEGVWYINEVAQLFPGEFIVGGHSKGGNIAVYSSIKCNCEVQDRISAVYSFDGPGFPKDIFSCPEYIRVKKRIHKYLPQSSVIGMIMEHQESYSVVESNQFWIFQHAPLSWMVEDDNFKYIYEIKATSAYMNKTLNNWINSVDMEKRKLFVETLFQVISVTNAKTLFDLTDEWKKNAISVLFAINEIDKKTKIIIARLIMSLFVFAANNILYG